MASFRVLHAEADGWPAEARRRLEEVATVETARLDRAGLLARMGDIDALIVRLGHQIDEEVFAAAGPRLRFLASATTGLDHVDLAAALRHGVEVISLRGEVDFLERIPATAEFTWALLLALTRKLPWAAADVRAGRWRREAFRGHDLAGRQLGLIGLGRVGRQVARFGLAFGMRVAACDPAPAQEVEGVHLCADLRELFGRSTVISVHAPLDDTTRGLLGERELGWLRRGSLLINTARGGLVDEAALVRALRDGRLAGAAIDVVANERDPAARAAGPLFRYLAEHGGEGRLLITPHLAGASYDSMAHTEIFIADRLARALSRPGPAEQIH